MAEKKMVQKCMSKTRINYFQNKPDHHQRKLKRKDDKPRRQSLAEIIQKARNNEQPSRAEDDLKENSLSTVEVILDAEVDLANKVQKLEGKRQHKENVTQYLT